MNTNIYTNVYTERELFAGCIDCWMICKKCSPSISTGLLLIAIDVFFDAENIVRVESFGMQRRVLQYISNVLSVDVKQSIVSAVRL